MTEKLWRITLVGLGVVFLLQGAWAAFDARSFADSVADFGPYNAHLVHDIGASTATFGIGLLAAARWAGWRTPMLALAAVWNGLHALSHVVDAEAAEPAALGPAEAIALVLVTLGLVVLARLSRRQERPPA